MTERIRALDWSATPLGAMDAWPQSLRTVVNILLSSRYQMWMAWGPELTMFYNDAYRPTLGIKHPRALGRPASEVWPEIWADIGPLIDTVLQTGKATYKEGLLLFLERSGFPEETYHTFSYSPLTDDAGRIAGMLCVVTEETDRLIGERRVETLRSVASALTSANTEDEVLKGLTDVLGRNRKDLPFTLTYLFDEEGTARLACSSGFSGTHPLAPERMEAGNDVPWPAAALFRNPSPRLESLAGQTEPGLPPAGAWNKPPNLCSVVTLKRQGQEQPAGFFVAGINPFRHYDSDYSGFIDLLSGQIAAALSNARAYQAERRRAEALAEIDRAKTTFFSNVSHELRTPLTLMLSPIEELLSKAGEGTGEDRKLLELVHRNGLRLQKLVNTLLDFSRIEAGRLQAAFEPVALAAYTAELAANFGSAMERAGLTFVIDCPRLPEPVYVDREMWEKIVLNLLSNALKFTFHGTVRISVRGFADRVEMSVQDSGIGIAAADLAHIFERFHRVEGAQSRTIEGTGIGLALVQELVRLHAGEIAVESEPGSGSTFTVSIPTGSRHLPKERVHAPGVAPSETRLDSFAEETPGLSSANPEAVQKMTQRILLAEDNADMRAYVGRLLAERFEVIPTSNGQEALDSALANPPDLILSDVMMPRIDGFGLLEELRKRPETSTIPVILLSARAGEESRVDGLGAGADDYLIEPFSARELLARVGAHLAMKKRREEGERAVAESQAMLQSFYDSSPFLMGIAELEGKDGVTVYGNRAAAEFFGAEQTLSANAMPSEHFRSSQESRSPVRFEYEHRAPLGTRWLSAAVNYLGDGPAGRARFSFVAEDITEKRRAREQLRRSNQELRRANADLEQFAYSASHDLQEPLRQVAIYSELLERQFREKFDPQALGYLDYCIEGAHRMEMLIHDLLAYSQAGNGAMDTADQVDLNQVMEQVRKNLATAIEQKGASLQVSPLPQVHGHTVALTLLLQNLISNALKYRREARPEIKVSAVPDGACWKIAVQDNGIGIPSQFLVQIFGLFKRLHDRKSYPGTGIGLAICQKIVERSGGRIWAESEVGRGSTFFFTWPMKQIS